jgi:hypothetical protein
MAFSVEYKVVLEILKTLLREKPGCEDVLSEKVKSEAM